MTTLPIDHVRFESMLYAAFPLEPLPALAFEPHTQFEWAARDYLAGKRWPEAVGARLTWGELDPGLSAWIRVLPQPLMAYFLPSHLLLAALALKHGDQSNYCADVMEALLLPPSADLADAAAIDDELGTEATVAGQGAFRLALYRVLSPAQRACAAAWLDLYAAHRPGEFSERGAQFYRANRDFWLNSSHPHLCAP